MSEVADSMASHTAVFPIPSEGRPCQPNFKTEIPHRNVEKLEHTGKNETLHSN